MGRNHKKLKQSESISQMDKLKAELLNEVELPQELINEILVRLPVKSLLKFKCVSKPWLSSISSPQFIRSHFSISSEPERELNSQVLITPKPSLRPSVDIKQISLYSALYEENPSNCVSDFDFPSLNEYNAAMIVGIINGLVCLKVKGSFVLWNPALRHFKFLPLPEVPGKKFVFSVNGFGYDLSNDDYKVVLLVSDNNVAVYSLLTDSWRIIEDLKIHWVPTVCYGEYANGKIHWLVGSSSSNLKITSLDMVTEKFGELQLPEYEHGVSKTRTHFGVSNERLFLLCKDLLKTDLWVMDKYGVRESWSKVVSVPCYELHPSPFMDDYMPQVVCILRNNKFVLSDGWGLSVYQPRNSMHIGLKIQKASLFQTYIESLVSPNR